MSKFHFISTFDYEIFGDGSGCLKRCLLDPIEQSLKIAAKYGSPQTFFVDFLEFVSFRQAYQNKHPLALYYQEVEDQLQELANSEHNIQLHLHPQWLNAKPNDAGWELDFSKWRIGDLSQKDISESIELGLDYAQSIGILNNSRNCKVFRAGGWAIQPSDIVLKMLHEHGIIMDSTVAPGAKNSAKGDWFDFKLAPSNRPFWKIKDDVCVEALDGGLIEVPISTQKIGKKAHFRALKEHRQHPGMPTDCNGSYFGPNNRVQTYKGKLSKLLNMGVVMLDTSTLPAWALIEATEAFMCRYANHEAPVPIVTIGHNKNFTDQSASNFDQYLNWAGSQRDIVFSDYLQWFDAYQQHIS